MDYNEIDPILEEWARSNNLHVFKMDREMEVRSIEVVSREGKRFQIWVDLPNSKNKIGVHVWDYKKKRQDYLTSPNELTDCLEKAYLTVKTWLK